MDNAAQLPDPETRLELVHVSAPHPAVIPVEDLLPLCEFRTQSRSGPGGQHRNRTASGVFITYRPAEITAEATEQRNQHRNRSVAVQRLRFVLAVSLRSVSPLEASLSGASPVEASSVGGLVQTPDPLERAVRQAYHKSSMKLADDNERKPGLLAMLLNDVHVAGGQPSLVAPLWAVSTSRIVACLRSHGPAWALVNRIRSHHGRPPLR
ncbi:RF-1 domain-containing protein [Neorhodopirellula lusitana]|uniref:RF-1 domain-containing protein n=1 Tax=Neorhodopirellula lusitana TaxID=445327 RepID=A0ABY1QNL5_9BACT|nr:peptide chain release factor-like protein [Neorhodopirellula lusitana]SMP76355.1 RF-1 domain-containing protein [Neorhodopirellula lusitana]